MFAIQDRTLKKTPPGAHFKQVLLLLFEVNVRVDLEFELL